MGRRRNPFSIVRGGVCGLTACLLLTSVASATSAAAHGKEPVDIKVGSDPVAVAFTPNSKAVYVVNSNSGTVTPISTSARKAGTAIRVGSDPDAIAVSPNGQTATSPTAVLRR